MLSVADSAGQRTHFSLETAGRTANPPAHPPPTNPRLATMLYIGGADRAESSAARPSSSGSQRSDSPGADSADASRSGGGSKGKGMAGKSAAAGLGSGVGGGGGDGEDGDDDEGRQNGDSWDTDFDGDGEGSDRVCGEEDEAAQEGGGEGVRLFAGKLGFGGIDACSEGRFELD